MPLAWETTLSEVYLSYVHRHSKQPLVFSSTGLGKPISNNEVTNAKDAAKMAGEALVDYVNETDKDIDLNDY